MRVSAFSLRYFHRAISVLMLLPVLLTLITGTIYQMFDLQGKGDQMEWLINAHKGNFGILNLETAYPFINALGLLGLAITGMFLWLKTRLKAKQK